MLVTLPIEFNTGRRAVTLLPVTLLQDRRTIAVEKEPGERRVLRAATLTYLVSAAVRVARLLF